MVLMAAEAAKMDKVDKVIYLTGAKMVRMVQLIAGEMEVEMEAEMGRPPQEETLDQAEVEGI